MTRSPAVAFVFITLLLDVLSLGIIIPILPLLVADLTGSHQNAAFWYGLFGLTWSGLQLFAAPFWGVLSDHCGRRKVILFSSFGLGLDHLLCFFAPGVIWLLVARALSAALSANFSVVNAYVADVSTNENRAKHFGLIGAAWGVGFVLGPAVGGALGQYDIRWPFAAAAVCTFANVVYGYFVLPESLLSAHRKKFSWRRANPIGSLRLLNSTPALRRWAKVYGIYFTMHYALTSIFVLYAAARYQWGAAQVGWALTYVGILSVLVQGALVRMVVKRWGEIRSLQIGLFGAALGFSLFALAHNGVLFYLGITIFSLVGLTTPALQSLMVKELPVAQQGALQGANGALNAICGLFAPLCFTAIFALSSDYWLGTAFLCAAALAIIGLLLSSRKMAG